MLRGETKSRRWKIIPQQRRTTCSKGPSQILGKGACKQKRKKKKKKQKKEKKKKKQPTSHKLVNAEAIEKGVECQELHKGKKKKHGFGVYKGCGRES